MSRLQGLRAVSKKSSRGGNVSKGIIVADHAASISKGLGSGSEFTRIETDNLLGITMSALDADGDGIFLSVELEVESLEAVVLDKLDLLRAVISLEASDIANDLPHAHSRGDCHLNARDHL